MKLDNNLLISFCWSQLLTLIPSSTRKIFNISAFKIEKRKQNNLLLFKLTQLLRHYHIRMRIIIVKTYYVNVTTEFPSNIRIQTCTSESFPIQSLSFLHGFIRLINSSVQIEYFSKFQICFELPCKFLFIVFLQLFLNYGYHLRYFIVLTSTKLRVYFFIAVVASVEVYEAFQRCIAIILEFITGVLPLSHVSHLLDHICHNISNRGIITFKGRIDSINIIFMLLLICSGISLNIQNILLALFLFLFGLPFFPKGKNNLLDFFLIILNMRVINNRIYYIPLHSQWIDRFTLRLGYVFNLMHLICAISASHYYLLSVINIKNIVIMELLEDFIRNNLTFYFCTIDFTKVLILILVFI